MLLTDEQGAPRERYSLYKSFVFDVSLGGASYHLTEGHWYRVEESLVTKLAAYLDPLCTDISLPNYNHPSEEAYNLAVAAGDNAFVCLDQKNISPSGQTQVEPCDLYSVSGAEAIFYHVKVSTFSSQLSHLFSQGANAIELLKSEPEALAKLQDLIKAGVPSSRYGAMVAPLSQLALKVVFSIVTHKDKIHKSKNLPLFSRITLARTMRAFQVMSVSAAFGFVPDDTPKTPGRKKPKKKGKAS